MRGFLPCVLAAALVLPAAQARAQGAPTAWRQAVGGRILGRPAAQADSVVLLCEDRSLRAYGRSGAELWRFEAGARLLPHLSRAPEGTCFFARTDGVFLAVNRSGRELWRRILDSPLASPALVGYDGRIFVATERSASCYSAAGVLKWRVPLPAKLSCPPVLDSFGGIILGTAAGVLRLSPFGEAGDVQASAASAAAVVDVRGRWTAALSDGSLLREGAEGGIEPIATLPAPAAALAEREGALAFLTRDGTVGLIDLGTEGSSGSIAWTGKAVPSAAWSFRFDDRGVYALGEAGAAAFSRDGRRLWNLTLSGASSPPEISDEGLLYSGGDDWILYAYTVEQRVRARSDALYGPAPEGSYGLGSGGSPYADDPFALREEAVAERLDSIAERIDRSDIRGDERGVSAELRAIASAGSGIPRRPGLPAVLPHQRERAVELLGALGSREYLPALANVFRRDGESVVRAAAARAIGAIGSDPEGFALSAFADAVLPPAPERDERLLAETASAIGALCRFSGPPLSAEGIRLLVSLSSGERPAVVRRRAQSELLSLTRNAER